MKMNTPKKVTYVDLVSKLQTINIFRGLTFINDDFKNIDELMSLLSPQTIGQKNTNGTFGNLDESLLMVVEKRIDELKVKIQQHNDNVSSRIKSTLSTKQQAAWNVLSGRSSYQNSYTGESGRRNGYSG